MTPRVHQAPISPYNLLHFSVNPALRALAEHGYPQAPALSQFLITVCGQETGFLWRRQVSRNGRPGPAAGRWQFLSGGGVAHVLQRAPYITQALIERNISLTPVAAHEALEHDDELAALFAALLVLHAPDIRLRIPPQNAQQGWHTYLRLWAPGAPKPRLWPRFWQLARIITYFPPPTEEL